MQTGLLHSSLGSCNGYPSVLEVGLSDAALALASGGAVGAQLSIGGRFGAAWAAVGLFQRQHLHVWRKMKWKVQTADGPENKEMKIIQTPHRIEYFLLHSVPDCAM